MPAAPSYKLPYERPSGYTYAADKDGRDMARLPRILYLEDNAAVAESVRDTLLKQVLDSVIDVVASRDDYLSALHAGDVDLILSNTRLSNFDGLSALKIARARCPQVPFIFISDQIDDAGLEEWRDAGATAFVSKNHLAQVVPAVRRALAVSRSPETRPSFADAASTCLIQAVQELSMARDMATVMAIVRRAARALTGADGATFVLREGELCHYAEENAIAPLWKGRRFPMHTCISGWAMLHGRSAVIDDIYADERIPVDAYRPTFVKSLAMVPIRPNAPIGAIGNYWAYPHRATPEELQLLEALANSTSIALENIQLYSELEQRVAERTAELVEANKELEAFSFAVSHDLRAPLRRIQSFSTILIEECSDRLGEEGQGHLKRVNRSAQHMEHVIDSLLTLSRTARVPVRREHVELSAIAAEVMAELALLNPERKLEFVCAPDLRVSGDPELLRLVMQNLLSNAWKFTVYQTRPHIEFGCDDSTPDGVQYYVRDNGVGFDMSLAGKLFTPFQRLHDQSEVAGTGVGLATVQRIIHRHGGRIWVDAKPREGACFYFTLPQDSHAASS